MSHLIVFGSIGFIVVAFIAACLILWALDNALSEEHDDTGGGLLATIFLTGFIALYYFFGSKDHVGSIISYFIENPSAILWSFVGYLGLGVIWAFVKWYFYLHKRVAKEMGNTMITPYTTVNIPIAGDNKWRIMSWMMYWPFSAVWTVINQPIKNAFNYIFIKLEGVFNSISKSMYKDVLAKVEAEQQKFKDAEDRKKREMNERTTFIESRNNEN